MNVIRQIIAISGKELRVFWTDKGAFGVYFLLPALLSLFMVGLPAQAAWSDEDGAAESALEFNVFVVNLDEGSSGAEMLRALSEVDLLNVENLSSAEEAAQKVADGEGDSAIIIPADFSQKIQNYEPTTVQVVIDPTQPETAGIVTGIVNNVVDEFALWGEINYGVRAVLTEAGAFDIADPAVVQEVEAQTMGIIMTQLNKARQDPFIAVSSENRSGVETLTELEQILASVQPTFAVMFAFFIAGPISMSIFSEKESGSLRRLIAAPINRRTIIMGKMPAYMLIVFLQVLLIFILGNFYGAPLGKSPLGLLLVTFALGLAVTGLGALLAAVARTGKQADTLALLLGFILAGIAGAIPVGTLRLAFRAEGLLGTLARLTPHGQALEGYFRIMAEGAGVAEVLVPVAILVGMSALFYAIAFWRFTFE
jgi:ABC-2 type transport system permease protein